MKFGFARVSKNDQSLDRQLDALKAEGCEEIVVEKLSGRKQQVKLDQLLSKLRRDDTLIVKSIDRLGRTSKELINLLDTLKIRNIDFVSLDERIDTNSIMGEALFKIIAILKQMELEILRERTKEGLKAARARGRTGGRPKGTYNKTKASAAAHRYQQGIPVAEILTDLKISRSTLYDYLRREGVK
ncbi:recombinase family protein [Fulvivirga maritima]|uniref:recombinase family protein n=1 Tax=Fulvivirga maritima TaxID=2904247 RepID=UPI001F48BCCD|nr:recombinase family protein [Fulvivirga maritima]UII29056.1 recombinase family protein [Fulvivirga maritima]